MMVAIMMRANARQPKACIDVDLGGLDFVCAVLALTWVVWVCSPQEPHRMGYKFVGGAEHMVLPCTYHIMLVMLHVSNQ